MPDFTIILVAVALAVFVFFQFRSSRKRAKETAERQASIGPGVEVMTNYGLFGTIVSVDEANNLAFIETSPGNVVKIHRSTILKAADDLVAPESDEELEEEGGGNTSFQLNEDNAIPAGEPKFGERVAPEAEPKKPVRKTTKKTAE
jgi:preprotein translocase subunit YajC